LQSLFLVWVQLVHPVTEAILASLFLEHLLFDTNQVNSLLNLLKTHALGPQEGTLLPCLLTLELILGTFNGHDVSEMMAARLPISHPITIKVRTVDKMLSMVTDTFYPDLE
jgi:hypothetical protein